MNIYVLSFHHPHDSSNLPPSWKARLRLRALRCNGSGAIVQTLTSDSPGLSYFLFLPASSRLALSIFLPLFTSVPPARFPLIMAGWLSLFQRSFSGSLINCLLSVRGVRRSVLHTFTSSAGLFSAALSSPFCRSSDKIVELRWQMENRGVTASAVAGKLCKPLAF